MATATTTCAGCSKTTATNATPKGVPRLPKGWHVSPADEKLCPECWSKRYRLRAITFPVAACLDADWSEFTTCLRQCWSLARNLANWAVTELAKAETPRGPTDTKLAKAPAVNLYQRWQEHHQRSAWTGATTSANALLRSVELNYRKRRLDVVWTGAASLPTYRFPVPYPVPNQSWEATFTEYTPEAAEAGPASRVPTVQVALGPRKFTLRLRGGKERARQLASFRQLVSGQAIRSELVLYRVRASQGAHRARSQERRAGGGTKVSYRILCKMVAWLPRGDSTDQRSGRLEVATHRRSFWLARDGERALPWSLHADQMRRWIAQYERRLQRLADDTKAEVRMPRWKKRMLLERIEVLKHRQRCRLDTFCHTAARLLAEYARRRGVAEVVYGDAQRGYFRNFPWQKLRLLVADKLDDYGIALVYGDGAKEASPEPEPTLE